MYSLLLLCLELYNLTLLSFATKTILIWTTIKEFIVSQFIDVRCTYLHTLIFEKRCILTIDSVRFNELKDFFFFLAK